MNTRRNDNVAAFFDNDCVAFFNTKGQVVCELCIDDNEGVDPIKIFIGNLRPYSQNCHKCGQTVYQGTANVQLFDPPNTCPCGVVLPNDKQAKCWPCFHKNFPDDKCNAPTCPYHSVQRCRNCNVPILDDEKWCSETCRCIASNERQKEAL